jgi:hypothetical protein
MRQHRGLRVMGLFCALAIVVLSLVPGSMRPHTGAPKTIEHLSAYALCGSIMALGYPRLRQVFLIAVLLVLGSAALEVSQTWAIARTPAVRDFGFSSFGACSGLMLGLCADRLLRRRHTSTPSEPTSSSSRPQPANPQGH